MQDTLDHIASKELTMRDFGKHTGSPEKNLSASSQVFSEELVDGCLTEVCMDCGADRHAFT